MTDKEQIIIDGVDVGGCKFFNNITENHYCFGIPCKDRPNCYFKQLARKTQALEEIEDYIYNNTDFDINDSIQSKTAGYDILQIIKDV